MSKAGLYLIAALSLGLALLLLTSAAPAQRLPATGFAVMLGLGATIAIRRAYRLPPLVSSAARPIADAIPDPTLFLRDLPRLVTRFREWAAPRGAPLDDAPALLGWLRECQDDLQDPAVDLLLPAIATYGELLRAELQGQWVPSRTLPGRELVIVRPGRPWTRRRALYEVLDALSA